jgi:hypothetical protein
MSDYTAEFCRVGWELETVWLWELLEEATWTDWYGGGGGGILEGIDCHSSAFSGVLFVIVQHQFATCTKEMISLILVYLQIISENYDSLAFIYFYLLLWICLAVIWYLLRIIIIIK